MSTNYVWQQKRTVYYIFGSFFHNQVGVVSQKVADVFVGTFYELHSQSETTFLCQINEFTVESKVIHPYIDALKLLFYKLTSTNTLSFSDIISE